MEEKDKNEIVQETQEQVDAQPVEKEIDWHEMYVRSVADCDNIRKRYEKRLAESSRNGLRHAVEKIIGPAFNDIVRGMKNGIDGCDVMYSNIVKSLQNEGIEILGWNIKHSIFVDDFMSAMSTVPTQDPASDNTVADLYEYGFYDLIDKKVITHAKVVVYKYIENKEA